MNRGPLLVLLAVAIVGPESADAQDTVFYAPGPCADSTSFHGGALGTARADFERVAEVAGQGHRSLRIVRRGSSQRFSTICRSVPWSSWGSPVTDSGGLTLTVLPARSKALLLTGYPADRNNGGMWAGRGLSAAVAGGFALDWEVLSVGVAPEVYYQQNTEFPISSIAAARTDRLRSIDWPSRMGTGSFASLEPGQSYARVDAYNVGLGVSTENVWIGPGLRNSILLTNTAPGFPHVFIGTSRPASVWIGDLDVQALWGRLEESPFYDDDPDNDRRLIAGIVATFEPRWVPGLQFGAVRMFTRMIPPGGLGLGDYLALFRNDLTNRTLGDDLSEERMDQVVELHARWVLPESGFEVYGEWARNDRSADLYDFVVEPDHGRAYLLGFQKVLEAGPRWVRLHGEILNLENSLSRLHRRHGAGYYEHNFVRQGHTHRGQLLGAWTGPGSSSQTLSADLFAEWGSVGIIAERVRRDTDFYFSTDNLRRGYPLKMDVELTGGLRGVVFPRSGALGLEVDWGLSYSHRYNRDFLPPDIGELEQGYRVDPNWNFQLGVTWYPGIEQRTILRPESIIGNR